MRNLSNNLINIFVLKSTRQKKFFCYNLLKGGDKNLKATRFHLCVILVLLFFSIIFNFVLDISTVMNLFLYISLFQILSSICIVYSLFEVTFLHEKQGSKLNLSKGKLSSK